MIADYDNDEKMIELGRSTARYKAIKNAREMIRNYAVMIGNENEFEAVKTLKTQLNAHIDGLIDALSTGKLEGI